MPKGVISAFMFFNKECVNQFKKENPNEKIEISKLAKESGVKWNEMTMINKEKYEKLQQKDHERYNDQLAQIRKNGYFTTEDGIKSTDLPVKQKKSKKAN